jgi:hypothetical protein
MEALQTHHPQQHSSQKQVKQSSMYINFNILQELLPWILQIELFVVVVVVIDDDCICVTVKNNTTLIYDHKQYQT